ncbi:uncharacterized protein LY89DRAFT_735054 [Mollisia scopiformis]|uniref:C2H2-type domain-containing protein n=1 Tax=Mollisia scopiformis TaxID=149040 RepID=A0A194X750_MOLSC|nr:uncharacterized protein LY89DRAFT_735054 [Mollisia scopiformis]KUJ15909.1 hypothetical protein LY89DRAFT_735054 [Mollisia scopiformis]
MANQQNYYHRNGPRTYMSSLPSITSTEPGQFHRHPREMRPPVPPHHMEIADLSISRTLPSPTATASSNLDLPPTHGYGEMPFGNPNIAKIYQQFPTDGQIMRPAQDPIHNWYSTNDGPWTPIPKVMPPNVMTDGRFQSKQTGSRNHITSGGQYRPHNPSESGSFHYGVPHSDSGYGTRRSVANTSVVSGDVLERDQDCHSLTGHVENFQPFMGSNDEMHQRDARSFEPWSTPVTSNPESRGMECPICHKLVKTQSEMKKHELRHTKPFECDAPGCTRTEGFSTPNDLERHRKSKHSEILTSSTGIKRFRCLVDGCKSKDKLWPRLDNFKSHLKRVHQSLSWSEDDMESMVKRGEIWEQAGRPVEEMSVEKHTLPDLAQPPTTFALQDSSIKPRIGQSWTPYPPAIEPAHDLIAPRGPQAGLYESRSATAEERSPIPEAPPQTIVKPGDVVRNYIPDTAPLDRMSLVPAGHDESSVPKPDQAKSHAASKTSPQGKVPRQNNASAATAQLTEALKTVLSKMDLSDMSNDPPPSTGNMERRSQPNKEDSPTDAWPTDPNPAMHTQDNDADASIPNPKGAKDSQAEKKALEVLRIISRLGFVVSKDPSHSPRQHNIGSAASQKSENQVTCKTCKKFTGRPCELKKHMKRHEKPYGCTFLTCNKVFGSKNDWKRHENSQHFHLEIWRCFETKPVEPPCTKVCYRKMTFQEHLRKDHHISDESLVKLKTDKCRIGRNCQARFWCGFCGKSVDLKKKGLDAWTERFDHIDDHFMGRNQQPKQSIREWIPVDSDKPKGDVASSSPHDQPIFGEPSSSSSSDKDAASGSGSGSGSENEVPGSSCVSSDDRRPTVGAAAGESSATAAINLEPQQRGPNPAVVAGGLGSKRRIGTSSSSDQDECSSSSRNPKRSKTTAYENVIICVSLHSSLP